jgi:hypothetical protein
MRNLLRIIVGIFGLLVALFCGGCALYFIDVEPLAIVIGGVPAVAGGLIAWRAFRHRREAVPDTPPDEETET